MSKSIEYFFEFGGQLTKIKGVGIDIRVGGTPCQLTGKYNTICLDDKITYSFEIKYTPNKTSECIEPTFIERLKGIEAKWVTTEYPETIRWVDISELHCRAVIHETFSCTTS